MNKLQKEALCRALLQPLNEMAKDQNKTQIVASTAQKITFKELMQLSDRELLELEKKVQSAKSAKKVQQNEKRYNENHKISLEHNSNKNFNIK